jgi:hypothetical protein
MGAILQHWNNQREIKHKSKKSIGNQMSRGGKRNGPGRKPGSKAPRLSPAPPQIKQELRERARKHTGTALETLVKICTSGESETARVSAASALLVVTAAALTLDAHMEKLRELRDEARQRGQLSAAIHAEVKRGEARRFYVKQVESGEAGEFDRVSDEELRAFIYGQEKILATLSGEGGGKKKH